MTQYNTKNYVPHLQDFLLSYNSSKHTFFRKELSPLEACLDENKTAVLDAHNIHYMKTLSKRKNTRKTFNIGDKVRVRKWTNPFSKGYRKKWSEEIFFIINKNDRMPIEMYQIVSSGNDGFEGNLNETPIEGNFYASELTLVRP